eukprot:gnl/MRDRNA2_/MRDRNA2_72992_c0_seq3.p1 gnl/MRDRNA2_/MRDRNA2_72992_c0~~gnl/MRDRNA2_/MRDRNA2_72992_c0_seq3.p1  ORF type:complete len:180 (-),score=25.83 gnl/MRDRNA2_/MRDRNA2_72992_c0_seq3:125-664(-)
MPLGMPMTPSAPSNEGCEVATVVDREKTPQLVSLQTPEKEKQFASQCLTANEKGNRSVAQSLMANEKGAKQVLAMLVGHWHDRRNDNRNSKYKLTMEESGDSISVRTTRPNGQVKVTRRLIHLQHEKHGAWNIVWGSGPSFVLQNPPTRSDEILSTVLWVGTSGRIQSSFTWKRDLNRV